MAAYGLARTTLDLDLVTEAAAQDELVDFLEAMGYTTLYRSPGYSNHLSADPGVKIVVVALSTGVRAFTFGAQDAGGRPYAEWVDQLAAKGVEFRICQNSMNALNLTKKDLIEKVQVVPSGVAEIARLQAREGFVYIRP